MTILDIILITYLTVCAITDLKYRKIYNSVTLPAIVIGLGLNFAIYGLPGMIDSSLGLAAGFIFLFVFYLFGGIGAGDVKFMMAAGSIAGLNTVLIGGVYGAIIGGFVSIGVLLHQKRFMAVVRDMFVRLYCLITFKTKESVIYDNEETAKLPYAVFLAAGLFIRWIEAAGK